MTEPRWLRTTIMSVGRQLATWAPVGHWMLIYFAYAQGVQPWGSKSLFYWVSGSMLFLPLTMFLPPIVLFVVGLVKRQWSNVLLAVVVTLAGMTAFRLFADFNWWIRRSAVERFAIRAQPLIDAIKRYERDRGVPPARLDVLVPGYLAEVPGTGLAAYPNFEYIGHATAEISERWSLRVFTSLGFVNWDLLLYLPSGRYPEIGYGGRIERIQDWAYVHE